MASAAEWLKIETSPDCNIRRISQFAGIFGNDTLNDLHLSLENMEAPSTCMGGTELKLGEQGSYGCREFGLT